MSLYTPKEFFNIENPHSPKVNLSFKVGISEGKTIWQSVVSGKQNNLFQKAVITDTSGYPQIELELFDKDFVYLEWLYTRFMLYRLYRSARSKEKVGQVTIQPNEKSMSSVDTEMQKFQYILGGKEPEGDVTGSDFKIKIGYYADTNSAGSNGVWNTRNIDPKTSGKTYYETDYIYFMILDVKQEPTDTGLSIKIKAISTVEALFNLKVVQKYGKLEGSFNDIIELIKKNILIPNEKELPTKIDVRTVPDDFPDVKKKYLVTLGDMIPRGTGYSISTKNIIGIFDDLCKQAPPKAVLQNGDVVKSKDLKEGQETKYFLEYYFYTTIKDKVNIVVFDYRKKQESSSTIDRRLYKIRTPDSIVKGFSVATSLDFFSLSTNIFQKLEGDKGGMAVTSAIPTIIYGIESKIDYEREDLLKTADVTWRAANVISDDLFSSSVFSLFVKDSIKLPNSSSQVTNALQILQKRVNEEAATEATLEIPGDPFYFLNEFVQPFVYQIEIQVARPKLVYIGSKEKGKEDQERQDVFNYRTEGVTKSHLSGVYLLVSATHTIDKTGYSTSLKLFRDGSIK